jgi:TldD protein
MNQYSSISIIQDTVKNQLSDKISHYRNLVDYLEIRLEDVQEENITLNQDGVRHIGASSSMGGNVRVCHKGGWGFSVFSSLDLLDTALNQAVNNAKLIGTGTTRLAPVTPVQDVVFNKMISSPYEIPVKDKMQMLEGYRDLFLSKKHEMIRTFHVGYAQKRVFKHFINTDGSHIIQEFAYIDLSMSATAFCDGQQTYIGKSWNTNDDYLSLTNKHDEISEIIKTAVEFSNAETPNAGEYPVILNPTLSATFAHESFGHTSEADLFASTPGGRETLKIGRKFGPEMLTIYDSGAIPHYSGYMKYDDEGVPAGRTDLIKNGVLTGRLHSRSTAADFDESPTGNARAMNYKFAPIVRMRNTCIQPGEQTLNELISNISLGVYAIDLYGGLGGENFSFTPSRGYMIRDGKLAEPIKNFTLSGNLFTTLHEVQGITGEEDVLTVETGGCGKMEQYPLNVGMTAPHMAFAKIKVSGN